MKTNKIILLIGREHLEKDSYLYRPILSKIKGIHLNVFSDSSWPFLRKVYPKITRIIPRFIRKQPCIKRLYTQIKEQFYSTLLNPTDYKLHIAFQRNPNSIPLRIEKLAKRLSKISRNTEITLIGRSAGAIVATMVSLNHPIHKIIALGYPFKFPNFDEEAYRHEHLMHIKNPCCLYRACKMFMGGEKLKRNTSLTQTRK